MKKLCAVALAASLTACGGDAPLTENTAAPAAPEQPAAATEVSGTQWYQDDLSTPVETVGVTDAQAILDSAGLTPAETLESADPEGEPKKVYVFNSDSPVTAQLGHSPNFVTLSWYQYDDEPDSLAESQKSLEAAYKIARAMAGREGADAVMYLSNGGKYQSKPVGGYETTGQCVNGNCFLTMSL